MKRVLLQPAYVLHRRSYRETSFLVELYTPDHGRISVLARGVRKLKSSTSGLLQPFFPLLVSWAGKGELMTLTHVESHGEAIRLEGECLFAGFYLNELMMCLLQKGDAHPGLFAVYEKAIAALQSTVLEQKTLRSFEKYLLEELGYGLLPKSDQTLHNMFLADQFYRFIPDQGLIPDNLGDQLNSGALTNVFSGKSLIAIAKEQWDDVDALRDAKRLTRFVLAPLLGNRPLYSRQLFVKLDEGRKNEE